MYLLNSQQYFLKPGVKPLLPGDRGSGIEKPAVPLTAFTENFSSITFIAPPPFGSVMDRTCKRLDFVLADSFCVACKNAAWSRLWLGAALVLLALGFGIVYVLVAINFVSGVAVR